MCVLIDANVAAEMFRSPAGEDWRPVVDWLFDSDGATVLGGHLTEELFEVRSAARALRALAQAGRAVRVADEAVGSEEQWVLASELCRSDDPHVLALARASGASTLCSRDRDLHHDFRNHRLISKPRGAVYQRPEHRHLLKHTSGCPGRRRD